MAALLITCSALTAEASLDLGRVDEYKLKSFSEYFGQYFDVANAEFDDKEFEIKLREEAADINRWLADPANWPAEDKIKPAMLSDAGWLFFYFANAGLEGAHEQSVKYLGKASAADPKNYDIPLRLTRMAASKGDASRADLIRFAEQAVAADPEAAAKENLHYLLADAHYKNGDFAKAYAALKKQAETGPDFENTSNLLFVWGMFVERWGRVPEKVIFKPTGDGAVRPEPADGV
jgi:tetratricopeptide (TPR) repeat protein